MSQLWIDRLLSSPTTRGLELSARFAEERQRVLADNVANIDTPDYRQQQLDPHAFQKTLGDAMERARSAPASGLELQGNRQVRLDARGSLAAQPEDDPAANALQHDGTNARLESLMTDVQQNALSYTMALNLLRSHYGDLMTAIRGTVK